MNRQIVNPYLPEWEYIPDGEPHVYEGRVWVYGSHDRAGGDTYCVDDYVVWSAPLKDLSDWICNGVIFRKEDDPENRDGKRQLYAPDVAKGRDGRYYLYYFLRGMKRICVAVSNTPEGPFQYYGDVHYPDGRLLDGGAPFDPGILSEKNGNWLYYGFCFPKKSEKNPEGHKKGGYCVELMDDMITIRSVPREVLPGAVKAQGTAYEGHGFLEASSIRHIGNWYYLVYSSEQGHELCYAMSLYPDRGFQYGGILISNVNLGYEGNREPENYMANNHGGMVCIKGQWYIFYHRHTHKGQYSRQGCAEKIEIAPDGKIKQVEATSCGLNDGPLLACFEYSAHIICGMRGPEGVLHLSSSVLRRDTDPYLYLEENRNQKNMYVANIRNGAECTVKYIKFSGEEKRLRIECRGDFKGLLCIWMREYNDLKKENLYMAAEMKIACDNRKKEWEHPETSCRTMEGVYAVTFRFFGEGTLDWNSFEFGREE